MQFLSKSLAEFLPVLAERSSAYQHGYAVGRVVGLILAAVLIAALVKKLFG